MGEQAKSEGCRVGARSSDEAAAAIVRRYAFEAAWPSESEKAVEAICQRMAVEIAAQYGREIYDVSLEDLGRAQASIEALAKRLRISNVRIGRIKRLVDLHKKVAPVLEVVGHLYRLGSAVRGDLGPLIRSLGLQVSGAPLVRVAGVWFAGSVLVELYRDEAGYQRVVKDQKESPLEGFDPVFDSFTLEQLRNLAVFMEIDARVTWDDGRLRKEIGDVLRSCYYNKVTALWNDVPPYKTLLLSVCDELKIPEANASHSVADLEPLVVAKVFADAIERIGPEKVAEMRATLDDSIGDSYWRNGIVASMGAGALVAGNLAGFGLYIAASSALAALGNGLGIGFAFTTYATMSSALGLVFGPLGIGASGIIAGFHWTKARPKQALPFVVYLATMRTRLELESKRSRWSWIYSRFVAVVRSLMRWRGR